MVNRLDKISRLFVTCGQGLEPLLAEELAELGFSEIYPGFRGVMVKAYHLEAVYRINYASRIGGRVLLPLSQFRCPDPNALYHYAEAINWNQYLSPKHTFAIDANVTHPKLRNSLYAAQVVKDAICDQMREKKGARPNVDTRDPDIQLNLYIRDGQATLSLDTSGLSLHKRGYRQETVEAPLQESLAAAFLRLAKYKGDEIMCDPCCGSGTLLIEAALIASKTAPGYLRKNWGFMNLPDFSQQDWLKVKAEYDSQRITLSKGHFFGCDISQGAVRASRINLRAAGFQDVVEIVQSDFREYTPPCSPNFVITNPPHGQRLSNPAILQSFYRSLGDFLKRMTAKPARGFIFTGNLELAKEVGLAAERRYVINNSGIDSRLLEFDLY